MTSQRYEIPESPQSSNTELEVPRLQGMKDYRCWATRMRISLRAVGAEHIIDWPPGLSAYTQHRDLNSKEEANAQDLLTSRLGKAALDCIQDAASLEEMWNKLKDQYLETGWKAESRLISQLVGLKFIACKDMEDYISRFRDLLESLSFIGRNMNDKMRVYLLLSGLDKEHWEWVRERPVNAIEESEPPRFDKITAQLLQKEQNKEESDESIDLGHHQ